MHDLTDTLRTIWCTDIVQWWQLASKAVFTDPMKCAERYGSLYECVWKSVYWMLESGSFTAWRNSAVLWQCRTFVTETRPISFAASMRQVALLSLSLSFEWITWTYRLCRNTVGSGYIVLVISGVQCLKLVRLRSWLIQHGADDRTTVEHYEMS